MKKIRLWSNGKLMSETCNDEVMDYIKQLENYIYYQSGIIEESWKIMFDKAIDNCIERDNEEE